MSQKLTQFLGTRLISSGPSSSASAPRNCVIFLHGSGASGVDIAQSVDPFLRSLPDTVLLYPTAPLRPYSLCDGCLSRVWHDRRGLDPQAPEDDEGIITMRSHLMDLVAQVNQRYDIPNNRIVVGGFSQGGHMSLHLGYRDLAKQTELTQSSTGIAQPLAGVFALSSFLAEGSAVYDAVKNSSNNSSTIPPPLFMAHGRSDSLVSFSWGKSTFDKLTNLGLELTFHEFDGDHQVSLEELHSLRTWIEKRFES